MHLKKRFSRFSAKGAKLFKNKYGKDCQDAHAFHPVGFNFLEYYGKDDIVLQYKLPVFERFRVVAMLSDYLLILLCDNKSNSDDLHVIQQ